MTKSLVHWIAPVRLPRLTCCNSFLLLSESASRRKLLQQVKRGSRTGAIQWTRLFVMLASAAELFNVVVDVHQGKGDFTLLADAIVMVFILAMAAIGLGILEMNERLAALVAVIGEEKLLQSKE